MIEQLDRHGAAQRVQRLRLIHSHDGVSIPALDIHELALFVPRPGDEVAVADRRLLCGVSHSVVTPVGSCAACQAGVGILRLAVGGAPLGPDQGVAAQMASAGSGPASSAPCRIPRPARAASSSGAQTSQYALSAWPSIRLRHSPMKRLSSGSSPTCTNTYRMCTPVRT